MDRRGQKSILDFMVLLGFFFFFGAWVSCTDVYADTVPTKEAAISITLEHEQSFKTIEWTQNNQVFFQVTAFPVQHFDDQVCRCFAINDLFENNTYYGQACRNSEGNWNVIKSEMASTSTKDFKSFSGTDDRVSSSHKEVEPNNLQISNEPAQNIDTDNMDINALFQQVQSMTGDLNSLFNNNQPITVVREGMPYQQVVDLVGLPTSTIHHQTGKGYIPGYAFWGGDTMRTVMFYKGQGRIVLSSSSAFTSDRQVLNVEIDPYEDGYNN